MSTEPKMTPWFPVGSKPARVGVYETDFLGSFGQRFQLGYSYWNGQRWHNNRPTPAEAAADDGAFSSQSKRWRGLASKP